MSRRVLVLSLLGLCACSVGDAPDDVSTPPPSYSSPSGRPPAQVGTYELHNDGDVPITFAAYEPPADLCIAASLFDGDVPARLPYGATVGGPLTTFELPAGAYATLPLRYSQCDGATRPYAVFATSLDDRAYLALSSSTVTVHGADGVYASGSLVELERVSTCAPPLRAATGPLELSGPLGAGAVDAVRFEGDCVVLEVPGVGDVEACHVPRWPFAATEKLTVTAAQDDVRVSGKNSTLKLWRVHEATDPRLTELFLALGDGAECGTEPTSAEIADCASVVRDVSVGVPGLTPLVVGTESPGERGRERWSTLVTDAVEYSLRSGCVAGAAALAPRTYDVGIVRFDQVL